MLRPLLKWLTPSLGIKRWLLVLLLGMVITALGLAFTLLKVINISALVAIPNTDDWLLIVTFVLSGPVLMILALRQVIVRVLEPYRRDQAMPIIDVMMQHSRRKRGPKCVAIGGGTGLPATLHGLKPFTTNITAVVTVADDGGSSGRLRRDMGVPPPGDLRNNIAALADDDSLLTQLFQYRFQEGELKGHSFGNLFIAALSDIVSQKSGNRHNSLAEALVEVERVLNIQGRVLPATLDDVNLGGVVRLSGTNRKINVRGESQIGDVEGTLESISLIPVDVQAYPLSVQAIVDAELIVIGPGSLYTSLLPNLLVKGIAQALRASSAYKIYVCNVATQPVETDGYSVAEHVMAIERHIGRGVFQAVLANNTDPNERLATTSHYVQRVPEHHEILQRYQIIYTDLRDEERPWRHDPAKLGAAIQTLLDQEFVSSPLIASVS